MTILTWVLAILALPVVLFLIWLGWVFVKEFVRASRDGDADAPDDGDDSGPYVLPEAAGALGMLPRDRQDTDWAGPPPAALTDALTAAGAGDWRPAAALLAGTGRDWELRAFHAYALAEEAAVDDTWLTAWEAASPADPDAALVRARSTVNLAWRVRGGKRAASTSSEQFAAFHTTLGRSRDEIARAAELGPDDPTPYVAAIWTALGLSEPHSRMNALWDEITARAPHHYEAHFSALQYWCAKWRGSAELARDFAARAAATAPPGSLLTAFPLIAWYEHHSDGAEPADHATPELTARVNAALADVAAAPPGHPRLPEVRHLLAYFLTMQDRDEASAEQFRLVDGYVKALPWRYDGDPAKWYCHLRDITVTNAAAARAV